MKATRKILIFIEDILETIVFLMAIIPIFLYYFIKLLQLKIRIDWRKRK